MSTKQQDKDLDKADSQRKWGVHQRKKQDCEAASR